MHRIVDLLLDNALVHAVAGTVRVEISHNADLATFSCAVIDGGPGLDGQQLATVLEPFVRYGDPRRLGIGLTRAARLARAAGGDVVLASDGTATVATVTLPLALG